MEIWRKQSVVMVSEIRQKGSYEIAGKWKDHKTGEEINRKSISGYIYDLGELQLGITNRMPDGKPVKAWLVTVLPEGLYWRSFRTRKDFEDWLIKDAETITKIVLKVRMNRLYGEQSARN